MRVVCYKNVIDKYKKYAKNHYPKELYAFLGGTIYDNYVEILDFYVPEDIDKFSDEGSVQIQSNWLQDAFSTFAENGLNLVGDLHTHPDIEPSPSETDWENVRNLKKYAKTHIFLMGILYIGKINGRFRYKLRFWPEIEEMKVKIKQKC